MNDAAAILCFSGRMERDDFIDCLLVATTFLTHDAELLLMLEGTAEVMIDKKVLHWPSHARFSPHRFSAEKRYYAKRLCLDVVERDDDGGVKGIALFALALFAVGPSRVKSRLFRMFTEKDAAHWLS